MNFTKYHLKEPTVINIVRNPVDWFASEYYFCRNGWERKPDYRGKGCENMNEHDLQMTLEECVRAKDPNVKRPTLSILSSFAEARRFVRRINKTTRKSDLH